MGVSFRVLDTAHEEGLAQASITGADPVDLVREELEVVEGERRHAGLSMNGWRIRPFGRGLVLHRVCYVDDTDIWSGNEQVQ